MIAAALQMQAKVCPDENLDRALKLIDDSCKAGARFVLLPEYFACYGSLIKMRAASKKSESILNSLQDCAVLKNIYILASGLLYSQKSTKKLVNESILISPEGEVIAKYRKRNLFNAKVNGRKYGEKVWLTPGKKYVVTDVDKWKIGLSTCFDLRFPLHYLALRKRGANIITAASAFTFETGKAHWETLAVARAIETQCYVIAPALTGESEGLRCYGHSLIIDPWGKILARTNNKEGIIVSETTFESLKLARDTIPIDYN
ncbi:MAG: nitrilase-related carbon-nitrogen hydrolase [Nitrospinota bacterium]